MPDCLNVLQAFWSRFLSAVDSYDCLMHAVATQQVYKPSMHTDTHTYIFWLFVTCRSLGCTVIEMLSGNPPWHEYEGVAAIFKIATQEPPINQIAKSASAVARDFLASCLCRDKERRPSSEELISHKFVNEFT
jgi:serine/threonine protein kinase